MIHLDAELTVLKKIVPKIFFDPSKFGNIVCLGQPTTCSSKIHSRRVYFYLKFWFSGKQDCVISWWKFDGVLVSPKGITTQPAEHRDFYIVFMFCVMFTRQPIRILKEQAVGCPKHTIFPNFDGAKMFSNNFFKTVNSASKCIMFPVCCSFTLCGVLLKSSSLESSEGVLQLL
jgi:hypothetical protein